MVKGLKVLRHKRTEGGCFSEFLIAKTQDDVENCAPAMRKYSATTAAQQRQQQQQLACAGQSQRGLPMEIAASRPIASQRPLQVASKAAATSSARIRTSPQASASDSDTARRAKRRERNRVAAAKCRKKRQDLMDSLADECQELESSNSQLEQEVAALASKYQELQQLLQSHEVVCSSGIHLPQAQVPLEFGLDIDLEAGDSLLTDEASLEGERVTFSPPPVSIATRPNDLLLPPATTSCDAHMLSLTTPSAGVLATPSFSSLLTPLAAVKPEPSD